MENRAITDRDLLFALFDALGALASRLTGERLVVMIPTPDGELDSVYASTASTRWVPLTDAMATTEEVRVLSSRPAEFVCKHP